MAVNFNILTEIVTGECQACQHRTLLVNIGFTEFRCITCGDVLEQKVNGVIKYIKANKATKFQQPSTTINE